MTFDPRRAPRALIVAALCLGAGAAVEAGPTAEDRTQLSLEQLLDLDVQSASKFAQKASEAPSAVSVVTAADIRRYGWRTLAEALDSVRGLYTHYDRNYRYLGANGFAPVGDYNSRVLLLVDGMRLNESVYGQAALGREFLLDVALIERIEFVPGPGSAIYGSNAVFGVVNVITRSGRSVGGTELAAEAGSDDAYGLRASVGRRTEAGLDLLLSASGYRARGRDLHFPEFEQPGLSDGIARGLDGERAPGVFGRASYAGFTFEAGASHRRKDVPTASFQTVFGDPRTHTVDAQSFAELRWEGAPAREVDVTARVNRGAYDYRGWMPFDDGSGTGTTVLGRDGSSSRWWSTEVQLLSRRFEGHTLLLGAEHRRDGRKDQVSYDVEPYFVYTDERHRGQQSGVFVQDEVALRPGLALSAGVRHDRYPHFGGITNPRLGLIWSVDAATVVKALHGTAYRAPNDFELYYASVPANWKGNPGLQPERIETSELVLDWRPASLARVTASAFHYRIRDLIALDTDPADGVQFFRNAGAATTDGLQGEVERLWTGGSTLRASVSLQRAADAQGVRLVNSPRWLAKADASTPLAGDALRGALSLRGVGARLTRSGGRVGAYARLDLTFSNEPPPRGLGWSASVYNLLDRRFRDPVSDGHLQESIEQDGRRLRIAATWRF